jgi:hypothetical protein
MRAFLIVLVAAVSGAVLQAGDQQACNSIENLFARHCVSAQPSPLRVDFGTTELPKLLPSKRPTRHEIDHARVFNSTNRIRPLNPSGWGFESAFTRGLSPIAPRTGETPIDCAMARPAHPTVDHRMVTPPPKAVHHSGVIRPVAPCR